MQIDHVDILHSQPPILRYAAPQAAKHHEELALSYRVSIEETNGTNHLIRIVLIMRFSLLRIAYPKSHDINQSHALLIYLSSRHF